jgi:multidrug efflux pump subunit AcrA (membrane-fusion protein)
MIKIFFPLVAIMITGCRERKAEAPKGRPPVPVVVSKCIRQNFPVSISSIGRCRAYNEVDVVAQVNGEVLSIDFKEGALVEQGQSLFHMDNRK